MRSLAERIACTTLATTALASLCSAQIGSNQNTDLRSILRNLSQGRDLTLGFSGATKLRLSDQLYSLSYAHSGFNALYETRFFDNRSDLTTFSFDTKRGALGLQGMFVRDGEAAFQRQQFSFGSSGFNATLTRTKVDKQFNRSADLTSLSDVDRKLIESERGSERFDLAAKLSFGKDFLLSTNRFNANNNELGTTRSGYNDLAELKFGSATRLSFQNDGFSKIVGGSEVEGRAHQLFSLQHDSRSFGFSAARDDLTTSAGGNSVRTSTTTLNLVPKTSLPIVAMAQFKDVTAAGNTEHTQLLDLNAQPSKWFSLHAQSLAVSRSAGESFERTYFGWNLNASSNWRIFGDFSSTSSDAKNDEQMRSFNLAATPLKGWALDAGVINRSHETTGQRADTALALRNTQPISLGGLKNVSLSAIYRDVKTNGETTEKVGLASVNAALGSARVGLEYLSAADPSGEQRGAYGLSYSQNSSKTSFNAQIKRRSAKLSDTSDSVVAQFDQQTNKREKIHLRFEQSPENEQHILVPATRLSLGYTLERKDGLVSQNALSYERAYKTNDWRMNISTGLSGKLRSGATLDAMIGLDYFSSQTGANALPTLRLNYEHRIANDNFISLQSGYNRDGWTLKLEAKKKF